jgi:hypothetical protein
MPKYLLKTNEFGDWKILYRDGQKLIEGHSFSLRDLFEVLDLELESMEISDEEMERICGE